MLFKSMNVYLFYSTTAHGGSSVVGTFPLYLLLPYYISGFIVKSYVASHIPVVYTM